MGREIEFELEPAVREVARARRLTAGALRSWGLEAEVPAIELAVSELVARAVRPGPGPGPLAVRLSERSGYLRLEVRAPRLASVPDDNQGRDLWFVDDVADVRGVSSAAGEVAIWMVRAVRAS